MRITVTTIILIMISVLIRLFYVNCNYKRIHENRHNISYKKFINNGSLEAVENYIFNNDIFSSKKANEQKIEIPLVNIEKTSTLIEEGV